VPCTLVSAGITAAFLNLASMEERLKYIFSSQRTPSYENAYRLETLNSEERNSIIIKLFQSCPILYQSAPFITPAKCKMLFNRNIKEASLT
jgi:hypothetical protein